jgi:hypothetical protein
MQDNVGKTLKDIGLSNCLPSRIPIAQEIRVRIDRRDCIKFKSSAPQRK